jgi:hypothetical protein
MSSLELLAAHSSLLKAQHVMKMLHDSLEFMSSDVRIELLPTCTAENINEISLVYEK